MTHMPDTPSPYQASNVYIPQAAPQTNGMGLAGFIVSLVGLLATCGLLCPIGLLFSVVALFKKPRGFAIAGTILGGLGTLALASIGVLFVTGVFWGIAAAQNTQARFHNQFAMETASLEIDQLYLQNGTLPNDVIGSQSISQSAMTDNWNQPLSYRKLASDRFEIISMGPDGQLNTPDDLKLEFTMSPNGTSQSNGSLIGSGWTTQGSTPTVPSPPTRAVPAQP